MTEDDKKLIERIKDLMHTHKNDEGSIILEITPQAALHVLQNWRGGHNRVEKPKAIRRYQADMENDDWLLNGSTVVFTDQHLLGDGQNRMAACIRAVKPFRTHVVFGVPQRYFRSIDQGRVRGPGDLLKISGVSNSAHVAQAVRWAELLETGKVPRRITFDAPAILRLYETKHDAVRDWLEEARAVHRLHGQPTGMVMALLYSFDKVDPELAADFGEAWGTGTVTARFRAITAMQTETTRLKNQTAGRVHDVVRVAMIINAWNAIRRGQKGRGSIIRWTLDQRFPDIF